MIQELKHARQVGAPLVAITTADQPATIQSIRTGLNGSAPLLEWNIIKGFSALNEPAQPVLAEFLRDRDPMALTNFTEALIAAEALPTRTVILIQNGHRYLDDHGPIQQLMNLRELFKSDRRTLILLGPDFRLPAELTQDVLILDEPLPSPEAIKASLTALFSEVFNSKNIVDDRELAGLVFQAHRILDGVNPDRLRDDASTRAAVKNGFSEIKATLDTMLQDKPRRTISFEE